MGDGGFARLWPGVRAETSAVQRKITILLHVSLRLQRESNHCVPQLRDLLANRRGNTALIFALLAFVVFAAAGAAVDFSSGYRAKSEADSAIDAAVLGAAASLRGDTDAWSDEKVATEKAKASVESYFATNTADLPPGTLTVVVKRVGLDLVVTGTFAGSVPGHFTRLFGKEAMDIASTASANVQSSPYIDITLLVDTSASMALGATSADIDRLKAQFGCAFACHDNPGKDSYSWAESNGVTLRYDLIQQAILHLADYLEDVNEGGKIQVQLYAFDDTLGSLSPLNASMNNLRKNLPTAPVTSSETAGGTRFWEYKDQIPGVIKKSGDGSTRGKAMQIVMMLTDGVQDPNRTWTWDTPLRDYVREFDWSVCDTVRDMGAGFGVVQVPYLEMTWDWGYNATLDQPSKLGRAGMKRIDDVTYALKKCGGDLYMLADTPDEIVESFQTLLERATPLRLVE